MSIEILRAIDYVEEERIEQIVVLLSQHCMRSGQDSIHSDHRI